jgi:hypothetical protein
LNNPHVSGVGVVVVGGYVYRGNAIPPLAGQYVFGDWSRSFTEPDGTLLAARPHGSTPWNFRELRIQHDDDGRLGHFLLAFGQDAEGEIYVLTNDMTGPSGTTGMVFKLLPPGPPSVD